MQVMGAVLREVEEWHWVPARRGGPDPAPSLQVIRPEPCGVCGSRIRFGRVAIKCRQCQLLLHLKCRERCPSPCAPQPRHRAWPHAVSCGTALLAVGFMAPGCWGSACLGHGAGQWAQSGSALSSPGRAG